MKLVAVIRARVDNERPGKDERQQHCADEVEEHHDPGESGLQGDNRDGARAKRGFRNGVLKFAQARWARVRKACSTPSIAFGRKTIAGLKRLGLPGAAETE